MVLSGVNLHALNVWGCKKTNKIKGIVSTDVAWIESRKRGGEKGNIFLQALRGEIYINNNKKKERNERGWVRPKKSQEVMQG
jgi:hypothetical protein